MSSEKEAKLKALKLTLDKLDKTYGKGAVMKMGDSAVEEMDVIPTGSLGLDLALGVGGYPKCRVIEIYGPESSGKTTLTLHEWLKLKKKGGLPHSLMLSMPLIDITRKNWGSILKI